MVYCKQKNNSDLKKGGKLKNMKNDVRNFSYITILDLMNVFISLIHENNYYTK